MILIKNGRVVDAKSNTDEVLDVVIDGGKIKTIGKVEDDGSYTFTLPYGDIYGLRIDPGIYYGLRFDVESITFNEPRSFLSWFTPTRTWALSFLVVPALSAAILKYAAALALRLHSAARREGGK